MRRVCVLFATLAFALTTLSASASLRARTKPQDAFLGVMPLSVTSWLVGGLTRGQVFELSTDAELPLLERFREPYRNHTPEWRAYFRGAYGPARRPWLPELCWFGDCSGREAADSEFAPFSLRAPAPLPFALAAAEAPLAFGGGLVPEPEAVSVRLRRGCPRWKAPPVVTVLRWAGEVERLALTDCSGGIAGDVVDRLSVLARPAGTSRPELPLPLAPDGESGEWTADVKLLHPRLIWAISELSRAFPGRAIVFMSGYRRDGHSGQHGKGRALDLYVRGVENEELFAFCRTLRDVGCGYYPHNQFVHVDVRPYGSGHVAWVDASEPGEPSRYVDGWPGVLASRAKRNARPNLNAASPAQPAEEASAAAVPSVPGAEGSSSTQAAAAEASASDVQGSSASTQPPVTEAMEPQVGAPSEEGAAAVAPPSASAEPADSGATPASASTSSSSD